MIKKILVLITAIFLCVPSYAESGYFTSPEEDSLFMQLREAAYNEDFQKAEQLAQQLKSYPIDSYVQYYRLKAKLRDASEDEIKAYLQKFTGSAIVDRLRNDWLLVIGEDKNWQKFDEEYPLFQLNDDLQLKCYALESRMAKGQNVAAEANTLLTSPKKYDKGCFSLMTALVQSDQFTQDDLWWQVRLAAEEGRKGIAQRIANLAGTDAESVAKAWNKYASILTRDPGQDRAAREIFLLALGQNAKKDHAQAADTLKRVSKELSAKEEAIGWAQIAYPASIALAAQALEYWKKAKKIPLSITAHEWRVRMALRTGNWRLVYEWINEMPETLQQDPAWIYWKGRAMLLLDYRSEARKAFETISHQFNFYGQLALEELGHKITLPRRTALAKEAEIESMRTNEGFKRAFKFFEMGLRLEGIREWNWQLRGMNERQLLAVAEFARQNNVFDRMIHTSGRTRNELDFSQRFPAPYYSYMRVIANELGLDIAWAYGLIRQESRFVANAKSVAGASGLMQLMPKTAKHVAKKIGMKDYTFKEINLIETNITLGSNYLKMVLEDLDGSQTLASAAYNAGPKRPKLWRSRLNQAVEGAIFAETIPFTETRNYVKNVMSNATYYAVLFEGRSQSLKERMGMILPDSENK